MSKFANFVRCRLIQDVGAEGKELHVSAVGGFSLPADPEEQEARVVVVDDPRRPTAIEVISYYMAQTTSSGSLLKVSKRGADGTEAQSWGAGAVVSQDLPAALFSCLAGDGADGEFLSLNGKYFQPKPMRLGSIEGNGPNHPILLKLGAAPANPDSGALIYLSDDLTLSVLFENGPPLNITS